MTLGRRKQGTLQNMESRRIPWPGRLAVIPVALASLMMVSITSCGSNSPGSASGTGSTATSATSTRSAASPATGSPSPASAGDTQVLCHDVDALRASISDLRNVPLNADAASALSQKVDTISAKLDQLKADAKGSLRPETDKLSAALLVLKSSLRNAAANPSTRNLSVIPPAITSVTTTANNVRTALPNC